MRTPRRRFSLAGVWLALGLGWASTTAAPGASTFRHDAAGNLTRVEASAASAPVLAPDPPPVTVGVGAPLRLTLPVANAGFASYQWYRNGEALPDATNALLRLESVGLGGAGRYSLVASNAHGTAATTDCDPVLGCLPLGGVTVALRPGYEHEMSSEGWVFPKPAGNSPAYPARIEGNVLRLVNGTGGQEVGAAWFAEPIYCRNGWEAEFRFRLRVTSMTGGSGFALWLQRDGPHVVNVPETGDGAVVRFDTFQAPGQTSGNSVAATSPGGGAVVRDLTPLGIRLEDGSVHRALVRHDGLRLSLWVDGQLAIDRAPVPLDRLVDAEGRAWFGFAARSGFDFDSQAWSAEQIDVLDWSLRPASRYLVDPAGPPEAEAPVGPANGAVRQGATGWVSAHYRKSHLRRGAPPGAADFPVLQDDALEYQWFHAGQALPDETNAVLRVSAMQPEQAGEYSVRLYGWQVGGLGGPVRVELGRATNALSVLVPLPVFGTGLDDQGGALPAGTTDPHWQLLPGSSSTDAPVALDANTVRNWSLYQSNSLAFWIGPTATSGGFTGYRFGTTFAIEPWQVPSAFVEGQWSAKALGTEIRLNGQPTGFPGTNHTAAVPFRMGAGLAAGSNALVFAVTNRTAFFAGVRIELSGTARATNSVWTGDSDDDGLPDAVEIDRFGTLHEESGADFDRDGASNAEELAEGTDPADAASVRPRLRLTSFGGQVLVEPPPAGPGWAYPPGTVVTLRALPNAGAVFLGWGGDLSGFEATKTLTLTKSLTVVGQFASPFGGRGWPVPGLVEAENFDEGGREVAYYDTDGGNNGAPYGGNHRVSDVDLAASGLASGGYRVGWTVAGEWLDYTLDVAAGGTYRLEVTGTSGTTGGTVRFALPGNASTKPIAFPGTGGWDNYRTLTSSVVRLDAGLRRVRLIVDASAGLDLDAFRVRAAANEAPTVAMVHPSPGTRVPLGAVVELTATAADADAGMGRVEFLVGEEVVGTDATEPYLARWTATALGTYLVRARAVDAAGASSLSEPVTVTVVPAWGFGGLRREVFAIPAGGTLDLLTNSANYPASPDHVEIVPRFESPPNWGDSYGVRLSGYLRPPATGSYRFYLSSDDQSVLWLSPDADPAHKVPIAREPVWSSYRDYVSGANQATRGNPPVNLSAEIPLVGGQAYYVEALLAEWNYGDHLSVAWHRPGDPAVANGTAPIPAQYLAWGPPPAGGFPRLVHAFYNRSVWDGNNPAANAADDDAIATDKSPLRPGGLATFAQYTSYSRGLNGLLVDLPTRAGPITAADFQFKVGNDSTPSGWASAPAPISVTVRTGAGGGGSDRVAIVWADRAIQKQWLETRVLATPNTGLVDPEVFYFGNAIGETGNSAADARVTAVDALRILGHVTGNADPTDVYDINRDGKVGAADRLITLGNLSALQPLLLINLSGQPAPQGGDSARSEAADLPGDPDLLGMPPPPDSSPLAQLESAPASTGRLAEGDPVLGATTVRLPWRWGKLPIRVWTARAMEGAEWEFFDEVRPHSEAGGASALILPVDAEEPGRFYRLEVLPGP